LVVRVGDHLVASPGPCAREMPLTPGSGLLAGCGEAV
jgi:hypothetical protein